MPTASSVLSLLSSDPFVHQLSLFSPVADHAKRSALSPLPSQRHIAAQFLPKLRRKLGLSADGKEGFIFVVHFIVPGDPSRFNFTTYFARRKSPAPSPSSAQSLLRPLSTPPPSLLPVSVASASPIAAATSAQADFSLQPTPSDTSSATIAPSLPTPGLTDAADTAFENSFARFLSGSDAYRRDRFKIIPNVAEGNWLVRRAVGNTPAILGKKLELSFYDYSKTKDNYFEIDVDVGSSSVRAFVPYSLCFL
jgi:hypothetical protein